MASPTFSDVLVKDENHFHQVQRLRVKGYINAVAWNTGGSQLAALSDFGRTITLWETKNWTVVKEFDRYGGGYSFNSLNFLPNGGLLTAAPIGYSSEDARYKSLEIFSLIEWNPKTAKAEHYIPELGYPPTDLSTKAVNTFTVSNDGSMIAAIKIDVLIYDAHTRLLMRRVAIPPLSAHQDGASSIAFSPDGNVVAVGTLFGKIHFVNLSDGSILSSINAFSDEQHQCSALAFSSRGDYIACGKHKVFDVENPSDIALEVWRIKDGARIAALKGATYKFNGKDEADVVRTVSWSPLENIVAVGDDESLRVWRINETGGELLLNKKISHGVFCTAFSSQGFFAATDNNEVVVYQ